MIKHTPGPWTLRTPEHFGVRHQYQVMFQHKTLGEMSIYPEPVTMTDADARLIASSPDLLAALRDLLARWDSQQDMDTKAGEALFENARAAIAKAEGKS